MLQSLSEAASPDAPEEARRYFAAPAVQQLTTMPAERIAPFLGLGHGFLAVNALFEAMEHANLVPGDEFWSDVSQAVHALLRPDGGDDVQRHLRDAAGKLQTAREALYSMPIHLLDIALVEDATLGTAWPGALAAGLPLNVLATGALLDRMERDAPARLAELRAVATPDRHPPLLEVIGGVVAERDDALLPLESQLWNVRAGRDAIRRAVGLVPETFARLRAAFTPQTPLILQTSGLRKAMSLGLDGSVTPNFRSAVVNWSGSDGRSIELVARSPHPADESQTYFNLAYRLHESITQDSAPTLLLIHRGKPAAPSYDDWLALSKLGPVLGEWTTVGRYLADAPAGEYHGVAAADDFFADALDERVTARRADAVSGFPAFWRTRRRLDAAFTFQALHRALTPPADADRAEDRMLVELENNFEAAGPDGDDILRKCVGGAGRGGCRQVGRPAASPLGGEQARLPRAESVFVHPPTGPGTRRRDGQLAGRGADQVGAVRRRQGPRRGGSAAPRLRLDTGPR